jgi:hypothetical protein
MGAILAKKAAVDKVSSENLSKLCFAVGGLLILLGVLLRLPGTDRLFRLPGDIRIEGRGYGLYFPWVSCLVLSAVLSLALYLVKTFFGRGPG